MQESIDHHKNPRQSSDRFNDDFLDTIENAYADHELIPTRRERELTYSDVVIHTPVMQRAEHANDVEDDTKSEPKKLMSESGQS